MGNVNTYWHCPLLPPPDGWADFLKSCSPLPTQVGGGCDVLELDSPNSIAKFLNQNLLFTWGTSHVKHILGFF